MRHPTYTILFGREARDLEEAKVQSYGKCRSSVVKWVGITGGLGCGKSTVARFLQDRGYPVIDADSIAKQVVGPGTPGLRAIINEFGTDILASDGSLNRMALSQLVFTRPKGLDSAKLPALDSALDRLEKIIHPLVQGEVKRQKEVLERNGQAFAFYDVPLLFEKNLQDQFDAILVVACSEAQQRLRLKNRNQWNDDEMTRRLQAQLPILEKVKLADFVIWNDSDLDHLKSSLDECLAQPFFSK